MGNRTLLTETLLIPSGVISGAYLETDGLVVIEAESAAQVLTSTTHTWQVRSTQSGYTGTAYLQALPDLDTLHQTAEITTSPTLAFPIDFTTSGTYTLWVRGSALNAAGDSLYIGLDEQTVAVTGFAPDTWSWQTTTPAGLTATLTVPSEGLYTLTVRMREDGLRLDRLLLTTDTTYLPTGFGPAETARQTGIFTDVLITLARTIAYDYDALYRLTQAEYTSGEQYSYSYDPVGNRLQQIIDGDTSTYTYDAANRLASVDEASYTFDDNGNLLTTGAMTNTWDAANRLVEIAVSSQLLAVSYDGLGNRVAQTVGVTTTYFALDVQGLPEVIYTSEDNAYLHLPGIMMTESATGTVRYLLSDGLGSVRQAIDENATVVSHKEFDPYGNPIVNGQSEIVNRYGYTGEWWEDEAGLLHLRVRWYLPEDGVFLSRDAMEGEPPYVYVRGNPVNQVDLSGFFPAGVIQNSLGPNVPISSSSFNGFLTCAGLYKLLLAAKDNDKIQTMRVSFDTAALDRYVIYPLEFSRDVYGYGYHPAKVRCVQGKLYFYQEGTGREFSDMDLDGFLWRINHGGVSIAKPWRASTFTNHYYNLQRNGQIVGIYDDLGGKKLLPDVVGSSLGVSIAFGAEGGKLADRYGNTYYYIGGTAGFSIKIGKIAKIIETIFKTSASISAAEMEGYWYGSSFPPSEIALQSVIGGWGLGAQGSVLVGFGASVPLHPVQLGRGLIWYSSGIQAGLDAFLGYTTSPKKEGDSGWNWVDNSNNPLRPKSFGDDSLPSNPIPIIDSCSCLF